MDVNISFKVFHGCVQNILRLSMDVNISSKVFHGCVQNILRHPWM